MLPLPLETAPAFSPAMPMAFMAWTDASNGLGFTESHVEPSCGKLGLCISLLTCHFISEGCPAVIFLHSISLVVAFCHIVACVNITQFSSLHVPLKCHHMILHNTDALRIAAPMLFIAIKSPSRACWRYLFAVSRSFFISVISTWVQRYNFNFEFRHPKDTKRKGSCKHLHKRLQLPSL